MGKARRLEFDSNDRLIGCSTGWSEDDEGNKGVWCTKNGKKYFMYKGMTVIESYRINEQRWGDDSSEFLLLPSREYKRMCSEINRYNANHIPSKGAIFLANAYYVYTYNREEELILCKIKVKIVGNEKYINSLGEEYGN